MLREGVNSPVSDVSKVEWNVFKCIRCVSRFYQELVQKLAEKSLILGYGWKHFTRHLCLFRGWVVSDTEYFDELVRLDLGEIRESLWREIQDYFASCWMFLAKVSCVSKA